MTSFLKTMMTVAALTLFSLALTACTPEVGSPQWCEDMKEKNKGDWSTNEATDFAKHCIF